MSHPDPVPAPRRPPGRPSKFTPERAAALIRLAREKGTARAAALGVGLGERTLQGWLALGRAGDPRYAGFARRFILATERYWHVHYRRPEGAAKRRAKWRAYRESRAAWWLAKLGPEEYYRRRINWWLNRHGWTPGLERLIAELRSRGFRVSARP